MKKKTNASKKIETRKKKRTYNPTKTHETKTLKPSTCRQQHPTSRTEKKLSKHFFNDDDKNKKRQNKCISSFNSGQAYLNIQQSKRCMPFQLASLGRPVILFLPSRGKFTGTTLNRFPSKHSSN